jgi:hypothetical protein
MLKKFRALLKYEFLFYFRILPPLYLVMLLAAFAARFHGNFSEMYGMFLLFVWSSMLAAITVITIVHIIQRFSDNFLKDPGSLMFTLPVTVWALTASKAVAAICMILISALAAVASSALIDMRSMDWFLQIMKGTLLSDIKIGFIILAAFAVLSNIFQQICLIYAVITASHILPRFRFAAGCAMYLAIMYFLQQTVYKFTEGIKGVNLVAPDYMFDMLRLEIDNGVFIFHTVLTGLAALALAAFFFWVTGFLLKRSFNLE